MSVFRAVDTLSSDDEHGEAQSVAKKKETKKPNQSPKDKPAVKAKACAKGKAKACAKGKASAKGKAATAKGKASAKPKTSTKVKDKAKGKAESTTPGPVKGEAEGSQEEAGSDAVEEPAEHNETTPKIMKRPSALRQTLKRPAAGSVCCTGMSCSYQFPTVDLGGQHVYSTVSLFVLTALCPAGPAKPDVEKSLKVSAVYQYSTTRKFAVKRDGKQIFQAGRELRCT